MHLEVVISVHQEHKLESRFHTDSIDISTRIRARVGWDIHPCERTESLALLLGSSVVCLRHGSPKVSKGCFDL